jgi:hypothetical protein
MLFLRSRGFKKLTHSECTRLLLHSVPGIPVWPVTHALHLFYHDSLTRPLMQKACIHCVFSYKHAITRSFVGFHSYFIHFFTIEHSHPSLSLSMFLSSILYSLSHIRLTHSSVTLSLALSRILCPVSHYYNTRTFLHSLFHSSPHVWFTHSLILSRTLYSLVQCSSHGPCTHFFHLTSQAPFIHYLFHPLFSCNETCNTVLRETRTGPSIFRHKKIRE